MESEIILTISVAAYNVEKYISRTLESCIVSEKYQGKLEVIVVNDGSTDKTSEIVQNYQEKYPHLFKVINKENGGYGSTINTSLEVANGKYYKLLDGDDWFDTLALEFFLDKADSYKADAIFLNYAMINSNTNKTKIVKYGSLEENVLYHDTKKNKFLNWEMHSIAVKTSILTLNKVKITEKCFYTDSEYILYIMRYAKNYLCFNLTLYQYCIGNEGQSVSRMGMVRHKFDAWKTLEQQLKIYNNTSEDIIKESMKPLIARHARFAMNAYLISGYTKKDKEKVMVFDNWIHKNSLQIYECMNEKKWIYLLRKINYHFYILFWLNALRMSNK